MPRPSNKDDLLALSTTNFTKLYKLIDSISDKNQLENFPFEDRDKNIKDVLVHLYEWHQLLLSWVNSNQNGEAKPFLPVSHNWKNYGDMNIEFWKKHQNTSLQKAKDILNQSHADVVNLISKFNDKELFTKKYFSWSGSTSVGSYAVSATSSHYDWAIKKIKKYKQFLKNNKQ